MSNGENQKILIEKKGDYKNGNVFREGSEGSNFSTDQS